tara:strand:+ start:584 stop:841 length:258 start_codon:yes stop_codon:yes gene_type:complete
MTARAPLGPDNRVTVAQAARELQVRRETVRAIVAGLRGLTIGSRTTYRWGSVVDAAEAYQAGAEVTPRPRAVGGSRWARRVGDVV